MGSGAFTAWSDVARFVALAEPLLPRPGNAEVYDEGYRAYRALYEAVKPAA
jgi:xylulokinase